MNRRRWVALAAALWMQVATGVHYTFPLYSSTIKSVLGFSQQQIALLGVANEVGGYVGFVASSVWCCHPPWAVLLGGAVCCFFGFGFLWFVVSRAVVGLPLLFLWVALSAATNGGGCLVNSVRYTSARNFPGRSRDVVCILESYGFLGVSLFAALYTFPLRGSPARLLLSLAVGLPAICTVLQFLVRPSESSHEDMDSESRHLRFIQASSALLSLYLLGFTILNSHVALSGGAAVGLLGVVLLFLLAPLAVPIKMTFFDAAPAEPTRTDPASNVTATMTQPLVEPTRTDSASGEIEQVDDTPQEAAESSSARAAASSSVRAAASSSVTAAAWSSGTADEVAAEGGGRVFFPPPRWADHPELDALFGKADFWLISLAFLTGTGSAVTVLNNLAQIGAAVGVEDPTILLCLFGSGSFLARLAEPAASKYIIRLGRRKKLLWTMSPQVMMACAYFLYAVGNTGSLYASTALLSVSFGLQTPILVKIVPDLFGLHHRLILCYLMMLGRPLGAFLFSTLLAGHLYDTESDWQKHTGGRSHGGEGSTSCLGRQCFGLTFIILAGGCVIGAVGFMGVRRFHLFVRLLRAL